MCITYLSRDSCRNLICKNLGRRKLVCIIRAVTTAREKVAAALPNWNEEIPLYLVISFFYHKVLNDEFMAEI